jgi:hypothetical protein
VIVLLMIDRFNRHQDTRLRRALDHNANSANDRLKLMTSAALRRCP